MGKKKNSKKKHGKVSLCDKILAEVKRSGKKPVSFKALLKACRSFKGFDFDDFTKCVEKLKRDGRIEENKIGFVSCEFSKLTPCKIVKLSKTFGFAREDEMGEDIFIPGKRLMGAMPGDSVLVKISKHKSGESREGEVMSITEEAFSRFSGEIVNEFGELKIMPDALSKFALSFDKPQEMELHEGDKVTAVITARGKSHKEHCCEIVSVFGSSMKASSCALAILEVNGIVPVFPAEVIDEARRVSDYRLIEREAANRLDLRDMPIFTIDGADTKDIDDAISVEREGDGYTLGVHIADVSFYVKPKSELDNEAMSRGTSVYYANRVIPMLPKELSNGICSLNPNEERLAFSCLCRLDSNGDIVSYKFAKSIIRSRVKGVYSEINDYFDGYKTKETEEKYKEVASCFPIIQELADKLYKKKKARGVPELETAESKLLINEQDICVGAVSKARGRTEEIIEDFMLIANECAARFGKEHELPFVYRIHEPPSEQKLDTLKEGLTALGIPFNFGDSVTPDKISAILQGVEGKPEAPIINNLVLRSMSKAQYSTEPLGHFGLVLEDYAHFTSPIRRYPDLSIHRIMSELLEGVPASEIASRYNKFAYASAEKSTAAEIKAMTVERDCEDCYKAEFMSSQIGEEFEGVISSVMDFGVFVMLDNTCEGLLAVEELGEGLFATNSFISLKNMTNGNEYRVGQPIRVRVKNANVNSGRIDFELA
ncbi:MAG: ribonuclease R [Ruminococcus sp.]|nr:ribonuclease R [Ruminococcus sp.]